MGRIIHPSGIAWIRISVWRAENREEREVGNQVLGDWVIG
jgi:hypothetical protein